MRALCGLFAPPDVPVSRREIETLVAAMAVCPTDRLTCWCERNAALAHFAQFVLPEDRSEDQPCADARRGVVLVTDAQLDNRAELAASFGWNAAEAGTRPDSAFVLAAYARWGEQSPRQLAGSFAFAAWHPREQRLFAAIDPLGMRQLYFTAQGGRFAFASTLRALLALPHVPDEIDDDAFAAHVARLPLVRPGTLYRGIERLQPGHCLHASAAGWRLTQYWNPDPARELRLGSDADYRAAFGAELERAIRAALARRDGAVATLLSGGLDSTAVTALAGRALAARGERLQAFHQTRPLANRYRQSGRELDETPFVAALRAHAPSIDFHLLGPEARPAPFSAWDDFFDVHRVPFRGLLSEPDASLEAELDRRGIGLVLDGLGGNYLVSVECQAEGYLASLALSGRWQTWWRELRAHQRVHGGRVRNLVRRSWLNPLFAGAAEPPGRERLLQPAFRARTQIDDRRREAVAARRRLAGDFRAQLHRVLTEVAVQQHVASPAVIWPFRATRRSASPLLDVRLNEFCLALPPNQQIRDGWDRRLVRETLRGLVPDSVRLRTSRGLPQPDFQAQFAAAREDLHREFLRLRDHPAVAERFDVRRIESAWTSGDGFAAELLLAQSLASMRFLAWHAGRRTSARHPLRPAPCAGAHFTNSSCSPQPPS
jgi:asparagine synthase (glutamine-hydrolysing)